MTRRNAKAASDAEAVASGEATALEAVASEEPGRAPTVPSEVRVECKAHKASTSRGRILLYQRINLPAAEAEQMAADNLVDIID